MSSQGSYFVQHRGWPGGLRWCSGSGGGACAGSRDPDRRSDAILSWNGAPSPADLNKQTE